MLEVMVQLRWLHLVETREVRAKMTRRLNAQLQELFDCESLADSADVLLLADHP